MADPVDALAREVARVGDWLEQLDSKDWDRPTRCPPLTVRELATHAARGAGRMLQMLGAPQETDEPEKDGVTYFQYDPATVGTGVVSRAKEEAAGDLGRGMPGSWTRLWNEALPLVRARLEEDPVVRSPLGSIHLSEYVRTRCVEVTIHAMDLRDALGLDPDPTPEGLEAACDVLRGLLGTDPRALGMDDVRFALVGTGRGKLSDAEREALGPLADSFPLLQ